jgi:two-component system OmpR family response regulator
VRVLLVEDHGDTLATTAAMLRFAKYEVMTAPNGAIALEMAKAMPPDVVLLDIGLPGMDGYRVARALREQHRGRKLYIAAVTGYGTAADKQRAAEAGIDAHLTKPAHPAAIVQLLEKVQSIAGKQKP